MSVEFVWVKQKPPENRENHVKFVKSSGNPERCLGSSHQSNINENMSELSQDEVSVYSGVEQTTIVLSSHILPFVKPR